LGAPGFVYTFFNQNSILHYFFYTIVPGRGENSVKMYYRFVGRLGKCMPEWLTCEFPFADKLFGHLLHNDQ